MPRVSQVILLVEDVHQQSLIYRYLRKCPKFAETQIRVAKSVAGKGSAEQWVRSNFAAELKALRTRQAETKLVVFIDADVVDAACRFRQLDEALRDAKSEPLDDGDLQRVARLVPKRNVETWIWCLNGNEVDEETDCKQNIKDGTDLIRKAAAELFKWTRTNADVPTNCVPTLKNGIVELRRAGLI